MYPLDLRSIGACLMRRPILLGRGVFWTKGLEGFAYVVVGAGVRLAVLRGVCQSQSDLSDRLLGKVGLRLSTTAKGLVFRRGKDIKKVRVAKIVWF